MQKLTAIQFSGVHIILVYKLSAPQDFITFDLHQVDNNVVTLESLPYIHQVVLKKGHLPSEETGFILQVIDFRVKFPRRSNKIIGIL